MAESATTPRASRTSNRWKWFLVLGVVLLILGATGVSMASLVKLASLLVFAPLVMASGIMHILAAFFAQERKETLLQLGAAALHLILGFLILAYPLQATIDLTALLAILLIVGGLLRLVWAFAIRARIWLWLVVAGVGALILGVCVWTRPLTGLWFVGLCLAIDIILHGISSTLLGLEERKPSPTLTP